MSEKEIENDKQQALDKEEKENEQIREMGELTLDQNVKRHRIELLTIIGEVEGHDAAPSQSKTTKYEHVLPKLAMIEDDENVEGLLILLNTVGGDVEAGLAIAEMIASLSIPTVSSGTWWRSFNRSTDGSVGRLFFCCAKCHDGNSSGAFEWDVYRCCSDLSEYGKNSGPYHRLYCGTFQSFAGTTGRTDAGYQSAGQRCRNASGR